MTHLFSTIICTTVYPKRFTIISGGLLNHHQCAASTLVMWWKPPSNRLVRSTNQLLC